MGRQGCYWCSLYAPIIGLSAEYEGFEVYYLDFGKIVDFSSSPAKMLDKDSYDTLNLDYKFPQPCNLQTILRSRDSFPCT